MGGVIDCSVPDAVLEKLSREHPEMDWERFWCKRMKKAMSYSTWMATKRCDNCDCERAHA